MSDKRVVVITGGGSGIGKSTAKALARVGFHVVINGRRDDVLAEAVEEIRELEPGATIEARPGDVSDPDFATSLIESVVADHGRIDALVNNAASVRPKNFAELTLEEWDATMNVVLRASVACSLAAARQMREQMSGRIIMVGSQSGVFSDPNLSPYNAGKAGLHSLGRSLAVDLARYNVAVNTIAPGWVWTPPLDRFLRDDQSFLRVINPMGRAGSSDECGEVIRYLVAEAPIFLTGTTIFFDGGETAMSKVSEAALANLYKPKEPQ